MTPEQSNPDVGAEAVGQTAPLGQPDPAAETDTDKLRANIAETRDELGETVEALSEKADVKAQAKAKVDEQKARLNDAQAQAKAKAGEVGGKAKENPVPLAAGGVVLLLILLWLIRRD